MKQVIAATTLLALAGSQVMAGGYTPPAYEPVVAPEIVIEEAASSSNQGLIVPLFALLVFATGLAQGGGGTVLSDARLKTDIRPTGETAAGLPLHTFRYIGGPTLYRGVMAQDVLRLRPDAIVPHASGYMMVDYARLGLTMTVAD